MPKKIFSKIFIKDVHKNSQWDVAHKLSNKNFFEKSITFNILFNLLNKWIFLLQGYQKLL